MPPTTIQQVYDEFTKNGQYVIYAKGNLGPTLAVWNSHFFAGGFPAAGSAPATGIANGTTCNKNTTGALPIDCRSGRKLYLAGYQHASANSATMLLVDRLAHVICAQNEASGNIIGVTGVARLDSAGAGNDFEGGQILCEVVTVGGAGTNTYNITYTNQDGVAGRTTKNFSVVLAAAGRTVWSNLDHGASTGDPFVELQDGDRSVRSIEALTLVAGTATGGTWSIALVRPIIDVPVFASYPLDRDCLAQVALAPEILGDSCLHFIGLPVSNNMNLWGTLRLVDLA